MITATNEDNMVLMARYPDNYFDLAIVDPPYGIGESGGDKKRNRGYKRVVKHTEKVWDLDTPDQSYFDELRRVSKNQIIWGANYMIDKIRTPKMCWIFWDKRIGGDFSDGELAWTSFNKALRMFKYSHVGDTKGGHTRIHPTQKPVPLYEWLLMNYAYKKNHLGINTSEGVKILDTHRGSASLDIACHNLGFDLVTCELDKEYFNDGNKRLAQHQAQIRMF
jgi:site-specific DNA-methyltransferase (adenine-specific)